MRKTKNFLANYWGPVDLARNERKTGLIGWLGLVSYIVFFDVFAIRTKKIETLTRFFWRAGNNKRSGVVVYFLWLVVTFHLLLESRVRPRIGRQD